MERPVEDHSDSKKEGVPSSGGDRLNEASNDPKLDGVPGGFVIGSESLTSEDQAKRLPPAASKKSVRWSSELVSNSAMYPDNVQSNPYVAPHVPTSSTSSSFKDKLDAVRDVLGRWGKKVGEVTKKAEDFAENTWQHLKTGPSFADTAMGRIAQGTKVLAEGGYEKIFRQTFETVPEEELRNSYACYLSTSAGPVMGILYVSSAKIAFCSDNPLPYKAGDKEEWSYYKVVMPLHQIKAVNPSSSKNNPGEKYIQIISVDNHEFWYMGFLNYDSAVICLREVSEAAAAHPL